MNDIKVSINCITYNHEKYIEKALEGFVSQITNFQFEILVHDDASTDKTQEIIRKYHEKYPDIIKPILQSENQYSKGKRISSTYNYPRAKGKYIASCEGDDYWIDKNKLQKQYDFMESNPECVMCFHPSAIFDVRNGVKAGEIRKFIGTKILPDNTFLYGGNAIAPTSSLFFKRRSIESTPNFLLGSESGDVFLVLYLSSLGKIGYIDEVMSVRNLWVEGSFNDRFYSESNKDNMINHRRNLVKLLEEFNIYTNRRYENEIAKVIVGNIREIFSLQNNDLLFKDEMFLKYYRNLIFIDKIKTIVNIKFPQKYKKIHCLGRDIINKFK